ncbi:MAG: NUDIX domain-containing protein [Anaerobacillus sp.]
MEDEQIKIFDENRRSIGVATRKEVHASGYWHEVFQCWFVCREHENDYIYFQLRSDSKKDYPCLYDITAAGHLLENETVEDGVREIEEELGVKVSFEELLPVTVMNASIEKENMIDKEIANVFLYRNDKTFNDFQLQLEEVSGIVRAEFNSFYNLWTGETEAIRVHGFRMLSAGEKKAVDETIRKHHFVPHEPSFYETVAKKIKEML